MRFLFILCSLIIGLQAQAYFYPESYIQSRETFMKLGDKLKEQYPDAYTQALTVPTETKMHLTIDTLFIPQQAEPTHLLIITSGIHGVEAFTGAAIQIEFLKKYLKPEWLQKMGILVVHSVNPYGFHFHRRVDEHNIDLNRNMSADERLFARKSNDYQNFESFLNPQQKLSAGFFNDVVLFFKTLVKLVKYGKGQIAQIAVGGQYQSPKGIYYGGSNNRPNAELLKTLFQHVGKDYPKIYHVDLHTGYGERGKLHFFSSKTVAQLPGFDKLFEGYEIDLGSDEDFYESSGDFNRFTTETFGDKQIVIPMTFEFGTMDSQTIMGGFFSLRNMIFENQGHHWGYTSDSDRQTIHHDFLEMFNPSEQEWRDQVIKNGTETLTTTTERFLEI